MPNARISFEFLLAIACAALSMAACNPVALVRPEADKVVVSGSSPPPAKGPVYSIDFDVRGCYQPGTLRVLLNGRDISSRYPCSSGTCGALTTPDDLRYVRNTAKAYVQTVAWTAAGNGNLFCGSANYSYDFLAYGLGYTCTPEDVATGAPGTSFAAMSYASLPSTNRCMMSGHGLGLSVRAGGSTAGTVFVELGVPAPSPNGLEIQILSDGNTDLTINNVAVNGQPPSTVISTVTVPMLDLRTSFTVSVSPARVPLGTTKLIRQITLKAPGFAPTELVVTIAR